MRSVLQLSEVLSTVCVGVGVQVRDWVVPINRRYPLADLMATLRELYPASLDTHTEAETGDSEIQPAVVADSNTGTSDAATAHRM